MREVIMYGGLRYRRYPDSKHAHHRKYFHTTGKRRGFLHRHKWEDAYGEIPTGHDIHHVDGDVNNNDLTNLISLPAGEHRAAHLKGRSSTAEHLAHLDRVRPLTKSWHASEEGRQKHREIAKAAWDVKPLHESACICCGALNTTPFPSRFKYCNDTCGARYRRRGPDEGR